MSNKLDKLENELEKVNFLRNKMKNEGFHYCFKHYSNWDEIEDEEFHKLRKYYLQYAELLENYLKVKTERLEKDIEDELY
jgi:Zn-finger domain-containing protein